MTKYSRITGKVFGSSADATGNDPEIGQFGSALAGTYNGTSDVATIQSLPAWQKGFISAVTPSTQFPPLPEMTGLCKVLSQQICYLLQQGVAEYDSGTTYYKGNWVSYNNELYFSIADGHTGVVPTDVSKWSKFTGGASRNLGEIVTSSLPLNDNTLHLADGSQLSQVDYPELFSYVASIYNDTLIWTGTYDSNLGNKKWSAITVKDSDLVAISENGYFAISNDNGLTWSVSQNLSNKDWQDLIYNGTNLVAIGYDGYIATSSNGTTWSETAVTNLGNNRWRSIAFDGTNYVALGERGYVSTSTDGTTWSVAAQDANLDSVSHYWREIIYDGTNFIVLHKEGYISTSTDGTTWSTPTQPLPSSNGWEDIYYDGTNYTVLGLAGKIATSTDLATWNVETALSTQAFWHSITHIGGIFVAIAGNSVGVNFGYQESVPNAPGFTTEADWQSEYTTYGECGKYVYNSGANTVRIPAVNSYFTNTTNVGILGNLTPASLPNIKGVLPASESVYKSGTPTPVYGAFGTDTYNVVSGQSDNTHFDNDLWNFDASRSSSVYKDSATTVNTQSIKQLVYIVVAK